MTESERKLIDAARKALIEKDDQLALEYYMEVTKENEDNAEASYWTYAALWQNCVDNQESNENKKTAFVAVSGTLVKAIEEIAASEWSKDVKMLVIGRFVGLYSLIADYAVKSKICAPDTRIQMAATTLYDAGNAIERVYASDPDVMIAACMAWKSAVKIQRQFYAYAYDGNKAEDYAAKIQKYQPDYVMPNKAGCISKG